MITDQQERFCQEYIKDLNRKQAAIRAGYSEKTAKEQGSRLLTIVHVAERCEELMEERSARTRIDADYVLTTIRDTIERCRQAEPVRDRQGKQVYVENEDGEIVPAYTFDAGNVLRGAELLGKHLVLFTEKHEHSGKDGAPIEFSDHEAAAKLAAILNAVRERNKE